MISVIETRSVIVEYPSIRGVLRLYDQGVSLKVDQGDFLAVLGGSGWGKSTLVNVVLGLEKPIHGSVSFRDRRHPGIVCKTMRLGQNSRRFSETHCATTDDSFAKLASSSIASRGPEKGAR